MSAILSCCVKIGLPSSVEADRAQVAPAGRSHSKNDIIWILFTVGFFLPDPEFAT